MDRETDIENKFVTWATDHELMPVKLNLAGRRGMPDRMILGHQGKMIFIEFKRPGERARKLQLHNHKILAERGFKVFIVESFVDAKSLCERHLL
jgi:hypothetical protein